MQVFFIFIQKNDYRTVLLQFYNHFLYLFCSIILKWCGVKPVFIIWYF
jgi:hypothetical protein